MTPTDQWKVRLSSFTSSLSDYFLSVGTSEQHFSSYLGIEASQNRNAVVHLYSLSFFHSLWQTLLKRHYLLHSSSLHRHSAVPVHTFYSFKASLSYSSLFRKIQDTGPLQPLLGPLSMDNLVPDNGPVVSVFCASHQCSRGLICKQQKRQKQQKEQKQQQQQKQQRQQQQQHQPVARHRIWCLCSCSCLCLWGRVGGCF